MTTQTPPTPPARRVFRYAGQTFADPGPDYTPEHVLQHLRQYFPELGRAAIDEEELEDGAVQFTFRKQVTHKGNGKDDPEPPDAGAADPAIAALVAALTAVSPYQDPMIPFYAALDDVRPLTLGVLRDHGELVQAGIDAEREAGVAVREVIRSCQTLSPIPLPYPIPA
jgi:PRTRC genetic system protein C